MTDHHEIYRRWRKSVNEATSPKPDPDDMAWDYMSMLQDIASDLSSFKFRTRDGAKELLRDLPKIKKLQSELGSLIFEIEKNLK